MKTRSFLSRIGAGLTLTLLAACSADSTSGPASTGPFVGDVVSTPAEGPRSISPFAKPGAPSRVKSLVTLSAKAIAERAFLFGSDLQYSGINDGTTQSAESTYTIGHVPVRFVDMTDRLQLLQDQTYLFESDVNHPERLIHEFPIVARQGDAITIEITQGSPALATFVTSSAAAPPRTSWVRSVEFVPSSNLLLLETSIEAADGKIYEFMESLFPRDTLVPSNAKPILADPDAEPLAARYNFIDSGRVWIDDDAKGRFETSIAAHYNVTPGQIIEWYVTPNIPDEFVPDVKAGIEGWNRYSQAMWHKDIIAFRGRLPDDVKIGDPRYNVVNWDTVQDAGSAWESQATDPLTGIQSHSLIYLPKAWFNFGTDEWNDGSLAEVKRTGMKTFLDTHKFLGQNLRAGCVREILKDATFTVVDDPVSFGHELVRGTLFHEVGHAFGLGHNFKGSLSYDFVNAKSYSSTIMDYNLYELDRASFASPASSTGMLLEYDRQAISALYNGGADIKAADPELPMCTDGDVPSGDAAGSIDPFCLWYDGGKDPTAFLQKNIDLLSNESAKLGTISSLPATLRRVSTLLPAASTIATDDDLDAAIADYVGHLKGVLFYFTRTRVTRGAYDAVYWLSVFTADSLPAGLAEADVHARAFTSYDFVSSYEKLAPAAKSALDATVAAAKAWIATTPAILAHPAADRAAARDTALAPVSGVADWSTSTLLPGVRGRVLSTLVHSKTLPYAFTRTPNVDYEKKAIDILEHALSTKVAGKARDLDERTKYATALATFRDLDAGNAAAQRVATLLQAEIAAAADATERAGLRDLLAALGGP